MKAFVIMHHIITCIVPTAERNGGCLTAAKQRVGYYRITWFVSKIPPELLLEKENSC